MNVVSTPEILAPAGDPSCYLAAIAAGADAVYVGLKHFSARMLAKNFSVSDLASLAELGRRKGRRTYVAMNTLVKPDEVDKAGRLVKRLVDHVGPDALIIQDQGMIDIARQAGYKGELHISTLANVSHQSQMALMPQLGISRAVMPRELSVDEIRMMAEACPENLSLEVFVHGALCHNISGRCYWSSFLGGKSGLRGRCVQPCRRVYEHQGEKGRFFSCLDLSLDVLAKTLLAIPKVSAWKIEGRKKGPHYVYYVVSAYKLLRDNPDDPKAKKAALEYLEQSLGRTGTNYSFLPQRPKNPVDHRDKTSSGLVAGKLSRAEKGGFNINARIALIPGDLLRIGNEDEPGHKVLKATRAVPKGGRLTVKFERGERPASGTQVFLIDRREPELVRILDELRQELETIPRIDADAPEVSIRPPRPLSAKRRPPFVAMDLWRHPDLLKIKGNFAVWVSTNRAHNLPLGRVKSAWWWMPPVIWPNEESEYVRLTDLIVTRGGKRFILNAPWQISLFKKRKDVEFWAGPFCNISNVMALESLHRMGFAGAVVSPELSGEDMLGLVKQSPLPLGVVIKGAWPLGVSRVLSPEIKTCVPLSSPKQEVCWAVRYDQNYYIYANWSVDLYKRREELSRAGYSLFINMREPMPREIPRKDRDCIFNWDIGLL